MCSRLEPACFLRASCTRARHAQTRNSSANTSYTHTGVTSHLMSMRSTFYHAVQVGSCGEAGYGTTCSSGLAKTGTLQRVSEDCPLLVCDFRKGQPAQTRAIKLVRKILSSSPLASGHKVQWLWTIRPAQKVCNALAGFAQK